MTMCGMTVWNTIANMRALDTSLGLFFEVLKSEIGNQDCWELWGSKEDAPSKTPNNWCSYALYMRYSLRKIPRGRGRNRGPGDLTVGVELWREVAEQEDLWEQAKQPLIYVGFSPGKNDWWSDDMALDCRGSPAWHSDEKVVSPTEDTPYLRRWSDNDRGRWSRRSWFFALPLCAIGRREDIETEIMVPLRALLVDNSGPGTAFDGTRAIR